MKDIVQMVIIAAGRNAMVSRKPNTPGAVVNEVGLYRLKIIVDLFSYQSYRLYSKPGHILPTEASE